MPLALILNVGGTLGHQMSELEVYENGNRLAWFTVDYQGLFVTGLESQTFYK